MIWLIRFVFIVIGSLLGYQLGSVVPWIREFSPWVGAALGVALAVLIIALEGLLKKLSTRGLSATLFGVVMGLFLCLTVVMTLDMIPVHWASEGPVRGAIALMCIYMGIAVAHRGRDEINVVLPYIKFQRQDQSEEIIILDTSVIIDGRISDICQTKFLEGRFVVPRFVLKELQQIADSQDAIKRNRGRRGLDVLAHIQKINHMDVRIREEDFPEIKEVDAKLVQLGKLLGGKILTNDFNLNKIAELQGIQVLNINELANALKPVVLPGELMEARVVKEGKEYNQGVAYLDDGTMVVVEQGRSLIGQTVKVLVTSVLQTAAGRMVFAKPEAEQKSGYKTS